MKRNQTADPANKPSVGMPSHHIGGPGYFPTLTGCGARFL